MFTRDGSVLFRNEMKPFYWLVFGLVTSYFFPIEWLFFVSEQYATVMYGRGLNLLADSKHLVFFRDFFNSETMVSEKLFIL